MKLTHPLTSIANFSGEIAWRLSRKSDWQLKSATEQERANPRIVLAAIRNRMPIGDIQYIAPSLRNDPEFMLKVLKSYNAVTSLRHADKSLFQDKKFMHAAVQIQGLAVQYAAEPFKDDAKFMLSAIRTDARAMSHIGQNLRTNATFLRDAINTNPLAQFYIPQDAVRPADPSPRRNTQNRTPAALAAAIAGTAALSILAMYLTPQEPCIPISCKWYQLACTPKECPPEEGILFSYVAATTIAACAAIGATAKAILNI